MKNWFRIATNNGLPMFVAIERKEIRDMLAKILKVRELEGVAKKDDLSEDEKFEAYCRALAKADMLLDASETIGQLDFGTFKFRYVAL